MRWSRLIIITAVCLVSLDAYAQLPQFDTMLPARSLGIVGGGRAYAAGGNSLYLNPATLAATKQYIIGVSHTLGVMQLPSDSGEWENEYANTSSVIWTDSTDNSMGLSMGLAYNFIWGENSSNLHASMAYAVHAETFDILLGIGGHYMEGAVDGETSLWSADAGLALNVKNSFQIGVAGYNLLSTGRADDGFPFGVGGGLAYWTGSWMLGFDVTAAFDTTTKYRHPQKPNHRADIVSYMGAIQYQAQEFVFLRGGLRYERGQETVDGRANPLVYGLGASVVFGKYAIELGFQQNVKDTYDVMVGLTIELYNPSSNLGY